MNDRSRPQSDIPRLPVKVLNAMSSRHLTQKLRTFSLPRKVTFSTKSQKAISASQDGSVAISVGGEKL